MIYRKSGGWEKDFDGPPQEKISESRAQHETSREEFLFDFSASKRVGMASHLHGFLIGSTRPTMRLYLLFDSESRGRKKTIESGGLVDWLRGRMGENILWLGKKNRIVC